MLNVGRVVETTCTRVFLGGLSLTSPFIELLSTVHHVMVHSRRRVRRVVVHATSVPFSEESLVMMSIGSLMIAVAATMHGTSGRRLKVHGGVWRSIEHLMDVLGLVLLDLHVISVNFYL